MSSLLARDRNASGMLTLPAQCVPVGEADTLSSKREAQLRWMRESGVHYLLGQPVARAMREERIARPKATVVRLAV